MKRLLLAALLALGFASPAFSAARLISTATGNINATGTWSVIDTTGTNAFLNSETGSTVVTTSPVSSSTFNPTNSETVTGFALKLAVLSGTTGTITAVIHDNTTTLDKCSVTLNLTDLPSYAATATAEGGWIVFGGCSFLTVVTDNYVINVQTSSSAQVTLWRDSTAANWSRFLITSGTQASGPAAGDQFYVMGNCTAAATCNSYVVTINTTALVNYGNVANTLVDPSIAVGKGGTLASGVAASTAYVSEVAGPVVAYNGGTFTLGTSGTPVPSTSSMVYTLNSTTEGDTGIVARNGSALNVYGTCVGVGMTRLSATANSGQTGLVTVDSTGWKSGDSLVVASTNYGGAQEDARTLNGDASGTSVTVNSNLTNQHTATTLSGTGANTGVALSATMAAEVIKLNHNVKIQGASTTQNGYIYAQANAKINIDCTEFNLMSGVQATTQKRGLEVDTGPAGTLSVTNSSFHDGHNQCITLAPANTNFGGTAGAYVLFQHIVMYNCATSGATSGNGLIVAAAAVSLTNPYWKIDDFTAIKNGDSSWQAINIVSQIGQFSNINASGNGTGNALAAINVGNSYGSGNIIGGNVGNTWGPFNIHSNVAYPLHLDGGAYGMSGTISGITMWHESGRFSPPCASGDLVIDPFYQVGTSFGIYQPTCGGGTLTVRNGVMGWDSGGTNPFVLTQDAKSNDVYFDNMELCPAAGALYGVTWISCGGGAGSTGLISIVHDLSTLGGLYSQSSSKVYLRNSSLLNGITTKWPTNNGEESFYGSKSFIVQDCNACTVNGNPLKHGAWVLGGYLSYDTAITHTSGYSLRMTPKITTFTASIAPSAAVGTAPVTTGSMTVTVVPSLSAQLGDAIYTAGGGFVPGTLITAGSSSPYTVSQSQTVSSGQIQSYRAGTLPRLQSAPYGMGFKVGVANGQAANVCVWARPSKNTDGASPWGQAAVTYSGDAPRMIARANPGMGLASDTVMGTSSLSAGTWSQFCANTPTAPNDGEFEVVIDADQTYSSADFGSVNISEWSCTICGNSNNLQFWWNGAPANAIALPSSSWIIGG